MFLSGCTSRHEDHGATHLPPVRAKALGPGWVRRRPASTKPSDEQEAERPNDRGGANRESSDEENLRARDWRNPGGDGHKTAQAAKEEKEEGDQGMNIDEKINRRAAAKVGRIDLRTGRPDAAYPKAEGHRAVPMVYVGEFSTALGLKPTRTAFGNEVVEI